MPSRFVLFILAACSLPVVGASAESSPVQGAWAITAGVQADDEQGAGAMVGLAYALGEDTWLSANGGFTRVAGLTAGEDIESRSMMLGLDHDFGGPGIELEVDFWGDPGELTRTAVAAGVYLAGDDSRLSVTGIYRDYTLTARIPDDQGNLLDEREFDMSSTGIELSARAGNERWFGSLRGAWFDYSRDVTVLQSRTAFRVLSLSALTLANSFLDYRIQGGVGVEWNLNSLELELGRAQNAVDDSGIRTATLIFVTPIGERTDIELSAGVNKLDGFDSSVIGGIAVSWYGR